MDLKNLLEIWNWAFGTAGNLFQVNSPGSFLMEGLDEIHLQKISLWKDVTIMFSLGVRLSKLNN